METSQPTLGDIPSQVFADFIDELSNTTFDKSILESLKKTIIDEHNISEAALRLALTPKPTDNDSDKED